MTGDNAYEPKSAAAQLQKSMDQKRVREMVSAEMHRAVEGMHNLGRSGGVPHPQPKLVGARPSSAVQQRRQGLGQQGVVTGATGT